MNTAIIASAQGICFATAVDTVQWVALQLLQHGRVRRGHLGIMAQTVRVPQRLRRHMDPAGNTAVRVMSTSAQGPARRGGLESGDLLVRFDHQSVADMDDLHRALQAERIGQRVPVDVCRVGHLLHLTVVPIEPPGE